MEHVARRFPRYSKLLQLYPAAYRRQYAEQMLQTLADMLDHASSPAERRFIWLRTATDLPLSLGKQHINYVGGIMAHDMPAYVKRSSFAGALLLAPFFILLTVHAITGNHMYASWFWEQAVLATWIIYMPALAVLISAIAFGYWIASHRKQQGFIKSIFDLPHNWPLLAVAALGAGVVALVLFHDSVHCIVHNPITELRNWHATWQCIQRG